MSLDTRGADDLVAELRAAQEASANRGAAIERVTEEAAGLVYYGESDDRSVLVNVDGNGVLVALQIDPAALRSAHPDRVGPAIVAAVATARAVAAGEKALRVAEVLGHG